MNKLEIRLWAMKRSGQHAIIEWIVDHTEGAILHVNNPLFERDNRFYHNVPPKTAKRDGASGIWIDKALYLFNVEDAKLGKHPKLIEKNVPLRNWGQSTGRGTPRSLRRWSLPVRPTVLASSTLRRGKSKRVVDLLIVRDPANFWASRIRVVDKQKKNAKVWFGPEALQLYRQYLNEALGQTKHLTHERTVVQFDRWTADETYRETLGAHLGLTGDYKEQYGKISQFGGGSSFGRKGDIETINERWKLMRDDQRLKKAFATVWEWPETKKLYGDNPYVLEAAEALIG